MERRKGHSKRYKQLVELFPLHIALACCLIVTSEIDKQDPDDLHPNITAGVRCLLQIDSPKQI